MLPDSTIYDMMRFLSISAGKPRIQSSLLLIAMATIHIYMYHHVMPSEKRYEMVHAAGSIDTSV